MNEITQVFLYKAKVVKVIDGDTFDADIDLGFYVTVRHRLRILGIDTPELNSTDPAERAKAVAALDYARSALMHPDASVFVNTHKADSFGRFLALVFFKMPNGEWHSLGDQMLLAGLAVPYKK